MYASPPDVASRLGRALTTEETTLVSIRLADVERMILRRLPDLADKITAETIDVEDVIQIEADAVVRLVRNPDGFISETDGTYGYTRELASGRLELLPEDWELLGVVAPVTVLVPTWSGSNPQGLTYNEFQRLKFATGG